MDTVLYIFTYIIYNNKIIIVLSSKPNRLIKSWSIDFYHTRRKNLLPLCIQYSNIHYVAVKIVWVQKRFKD